MSRADELTRLDHAHVIHPHATIGRPEAPVVFVRGEGALLWDIEGRRYVDGTCGLWQCAVGHGRRELTDVAADQMARLEFYPSFWDFSNEPAIRLAARLADLAPETISRVFFTNGGSEGVETAIKMARLAWHAQGQTDRTVILSRQGAYHGMGAASLAATGIPKLKEGFGPPAPGFVHLGIPHARAIDEDPTETLTAELRDAIQEIGPERIAAFIGEPVLGVGGMIPPPEGYWEAVQQILNQHGILLILDEVVTAFGRTGYWFAAERYGIRPDLIVTAKALTSGYVPMGAVLVGDRIFDMLDGVPFRHGFTYNGHQVGAAVALTNLDIIEREGLAQRAVEIGERALKGLRSLENLSAVAEVRGVGLMLGIEIEGDEADRVATAARRAGVIVRATGNKVVMSPPLVIEPEQADQIVEVVGEEVSKL